MFVSKDENKRREAWDGPFKKLLKITRIRAWINQQTDGKSRKYYVG